MSTEAEGKPVGIVEAKRPAITDPAIIVTTLSILKARLGYLSALLTEQAKTTDAKTQPCNYQVYRFLANSFLEAETALAHMCDDAKIVLNRDEPTEFFVLAKASETIDAAEASVYDCIFESQKLDELPPGNPGEAEFERQLKPKIALNRSFTQCMHKLALLHNALFSDTYKLGITEEERAKAWRAARKTKLEAILTDIDKQVVEAKAFLDSLDKARTAVLKRLANNEEIKFDSEIDPTKAPESGE